VAFLACFYNTFAWLVYKYEFRDSYYSHGFFIPFISGYLIYLKRKQLARIEIENESLGLIAIIFSLLVHVIATVSDINFISGFAMFIYIFGSCFYLLGRKVTKVIFFPIFFLIFMFPIPNAFINIVGLPTKSFATNLGLQIIDAFGIPFYREGFVINLPNAVIVVGTPCNGMKSMISFLALGTLFMHLSNTKIATQVLIFLFIYPITVAVNTIRITMLVFVADNFGVEKIAPDSLLHTLSGLIVFIIGLCFLYLLIKVLSKNE
jgi:exosortase